MSKKEIVDKIWEADGQLKMAIILNPDPRKVYQSMDEYAKEQAIGFAEWASGNNYSFRGDIWIHLARHVEGLPIRATTEELYELYLSTLK